PFVLARYGGMTFTGSLRAFVLDLHAPLAHFLFSIVRPPPSSTLFPYTTLFRSFAMGAAFLVGAGRAAKCVPCAPTSLQARALVRSEEHTSELQSPCNLVCRLLLEKKKPNFQLTREDMRHGEARVIRSTSRVPTR